MNAPAGAGSQVSAQVQSVPLLDVNRGNAPLRDAMLAAITKVVDSGRFLFGPDVAQLEQSVAHWCGAKHGVSCASGSDAILLALLALDIGPGDEVIVPSFTFFATASAVVRVGARPVFVDIDPRTFNLDPQQVEDAVAPSTRAIIPVHLFGQAADMRAIMDLARRRGLHVIEDAAQAIGATFGERPVGGIGTIGCTSFYPTKNLGGMGDGGMLTTQDDALAARLRLFAAHGMSPRYYHQVVGINSRLDTIQAAILNVKIAHLEEWSRLRTAHAARYSQLLPAAGLNEHLSLPVANPEGRHVWNQFTVRVKHGLRDSVKQQLGQAGVGSEVYYPVPLHLQECFAGLGYRRGDLPHTERAAAEVLSLPVFPEMTTSEQDYVVSRLSTCFAQPLSRAA